MAVAAESLASVSSGSSWDETNSRLEAVRGPLYRLHEPEAFSNAQIEYVRRSDEEWEAMRTRKAEADLAETGLRWP